MGSELVGDSLPHKGGGSTDTTALSYTEVFYKHLPYYIAIGMPIDLFWDGDCRLAESYRRADDIKQRRLNQELWLQGLYFYEALCDVAPALHAFSSKPEPTPYPEEPFAITAKEIEERRIKEAKRRYDEMKIKVRSWAVKTNKQFAHQEGEEVEGG